MRPKGTKWGMNQKHFLQHEKDSAHRMGEVSLIQRAEQSLRRRAWNLLGVRTLRPEDTALVNNLKLSLSQVVLKRKNYFHGHV